MYTIKRVPRPSEFESKQKEKKKKGDGPYRKWPRLDHPRIVTMKLARLVERRKARRWKEGKQVGDFEDERREKKRRKRRNTYCRGNATRDRVTWTNWRGAGEVGTRPAGQRTARNTDTTLLWDSVRSLSRPTIKIFTHRTFSARLRTPFEQLEPLARRNSSALYKIFSRV